MKRGKIIVIAGTDGSGKATQGGLLVERLKRTGLKTEFADFPQYGKRSATMVEDYLNGKFGSAQEVGPYRATIFYACDRYAKSFDIRKWVNEGKIVVCNRYVSANMGHQAGKIKDAGDRNKFLNWLLDLEFNIFGIPQPNLNLLLYVDPIIGQKLVDEKGVRGYVSGEGRDMHEKDLQHLEDAAEAYVFCAKKFSWPIINCVVGGKMRTRKDIANEVWRNVEPVLSD